MTQLTGCNYDVNEEIPAEFDRTTDDANEFAAMIEAFDWAVNLGGAYGPPKVSRRIAYLAVGQAPNWYKTHMSHAQPPLSTTIKHLAKSISTTGLTPTYVRGCCRSLAPYCKPYNVVLAKPRIKHARRPHKGISSLWFFACWLIMAAVAYGGQVHNNDHVTGPVTGAAASATVVAEPGTKKRHIVAQSNGTINITFDDCRENDLGHVSCQFEAPDGSTHWVYLPGVSLPKAR